jgi:hypothetical protein
MRVDADPGRTHAVRYRGDRATVAPAPAMRWFLRGFGLVGAAAVGAAARLLPRPSPAVPRYASATLLIAGLLIAGGCLLLLARRLRIDRRHGLRLPRHAVVEGTFPARHVRPDGLAAVQLCATRRPAEHASLFHVPIRVPAYTTVQVNLVCRPSAGGGRVHVLSDTDGRRAERAARELAAFLGLPVLDHRS